MSDASRIALPIPTGLIEAIARRAAELVLEQLGDRHATDQTPWLDTHEAADYLRIPRGTFKQLATRRELPVHAEGKRLYFRRDELDQWRRGHRDPQTA